MINLSDLIKNNQHLTKLGRVAQYIPALSEANPDKIGICLMDINGEIHTAGDYSTKFTIQSISKVVALMLAIMDNGMEKVFQKVGCEGTDETFNSFRKLDLPHILKPTNPMINAGAIVTTSLIKGDKDEKFNRILELTRLLTNNSTLNINTTVYLSEKETGDKNRAMAYLMKSRDIINGNVDDILDTYFKQCSIEVNSVDIANMGLFIASGCKGLNTSSLIKNEDLSRVITAIMSSSGMYNYSGEYMIKVGMPSKSGVGGGIMATLPWKLGIGVYSPSLDKNGNPIAGIGIMEELSKELKLSLY